MDTKEIRAEAGALLDQAQVAIEQGEMETFQRLANEAQSTMEKADSIDEEIGRASCRERV